jgi:hypothetical protein
VQQMILLDGESNEKYMRINSINISLSGHLDIVCIIINNARNIKV